MIDVKEKSDVVIVFSVLSVLVELEYFDGGEEIYGFGIKMGLDFDFFISNLLIDMYVKLGVLIEVFSIFYSMNVKNVVIWNVMVVNFV